MKLKIVWGSYFSAKTSLKLISTKNKVRVSFCPVFHTAPFSPNPKAKLRLEKFVQEISS
jgi:hypothetical protein